MSQIHLTPLIHHGEIELFSMPRCHSVQSAISFLAQQLDAPVANCCRLPWDRPLIYLLWGTSWLSGQSVSGGINISMFIQCIRSHESTCTFGMFFPQNSYTKFHWDFEAFLGLNRTFLKLVPFKSMRQTLKPIYVGFSDFSDSWWYNIKKTQQGLCQVDYLYF